MHHIYTTESLILKREPQDSSAYYYILTKDLGLIRARAQGVRGMKSRLKGALQEFSLSTIAYVHGKAGWKITTAIPDKNFFTEAGGDDPASPRLRRTREIIARISDCLIRLIPGEEKSAEIFTVVEKGFSELVKNEKDASLVEAIILSRILYTLGLLAKDETTSEILKEHSDFSEPVLSHTLTHKALVIKAINIGFKESQL